MVKVREDIPTTETGQVDIDAWVTRVCDAHEHLRSDSLAAVAHAVEASAPDLVVRGLELAELIADLNLDQPAVAAGIIYRCIREERVEQAELAAWAGDDAAHIAADVASMATTSLLEMTNSPLLEKEQQDQVENVKRMLVALMNDARVAVCKLAERLLALRQAKHFDKDRRIRIAREAQAVFAPLAGRLGIWQLKWEIEDLALRYTQEEVYQSIAKQLRGKRAEREMQVEHMVDQVRGLLRGHGIDATVYGRAKNIFSIWRKMQAKGVSFDQVYDVRAVRVVVDTLADCYAALGVLHTTWPHIPSEFDDYIANPKENGYQSIHTAVTAADDRTLEIQIRTRAMHEDAELGVCAHWSYKDGGAEDANYTAKMDWLRQVMEWHEDLGGTESLGALLRHRISDKRIFVSTPKGHVLELPAGATVLDFAYRVHTDVGHACRGARVNGVTAHLNQVLETGQQVEIITAPSGRPLRDWLEPELEFVYSDRARAKLVRFFRSLPPAEQETLGREALESKFVALGVDDFPEADLESFARDHGDADMQTLCRDIGAGARSVTGTIVEVLEHGASREQLRLPGMRAAEFPVSERMRIVGDNRDGLLHDITQVIGSLGIDLTGTTGRVSEPGAEAIITVDVTLTDWRQAVKFVSFLSLVEGVTEIRKAS